MTGLLQHMLDGLRIAKDMHHGMTKDRGEKQHRDFIRMANKKKRGLKKRKNR